MEKPRNLAVVAAVAALGLSVGGGLPAMAQQSNQPRAQNPQQQSQPNMSGSAQKNNSAQNQPAGQNQTASAKLDRSQIERVQRTLDQKGFKSGRADGIVGRETEEALRSFQQKQGLQASGQIDQQTLAALGLNDMAQPSTVGQSQNHQDQQQPAASNNQANSATSSSTGSTDQLKLTSAQRNEIWKSLSSQAKETPPNGFTAKVGEAVPSALHLQPLPSNVTSSVPAVKSYDFAMLQNEVLLVDPSWRKIVDIVTE